MKTNLLTDYRMTQVIVYIFFLLSGTLSFAQNKIYSSSQINQITGICLGCNIFNQQNAVGSNESDYSTLKFGIGALAKIEQTLIFQESTTKKLAIGIGTDNTPLSIGLLNGATVETMKGDISNNDAKIINSSILTLDAQVNNRATIELTPTAQYDRVKITLNGGLLNVSGGLRIYYAYYEDRCMPALYPIHHYSFNGNTLDIPSGGLDLTRISSHEESFSGNMICDQGLTYSSADSTYVLKGNNYLNVPSPREPRTVSFWARIEKAGSIDLTIYGEKIKITQDSIIIKPVNENNLHSNKAYFGKMFRSNPAIAGSFNFYVINFNNDPTPPYAVSSTLYAPNNQTNPPYYPVDVRLTVNTQGLTGPFMLFHSNNFSSTYPLTIQTTHWAPYYIQGANLNNEFIISYKSSQIDEFLIYNRKLYPEELFNAYSHSPANSFTTSKVSSSHENEFFRVSPNPTTGQITLNGNILFIDSNIFITNTSGKEVYHSKFTSKTFELPSAIPTGVYILNVQTKDRKIYSSKIILTR
ncbi:hypothetical protein C1637_04245 [Chryseobacterium lactis]|uniref:T9SS C-terminal target domain-containing protein n=1 Tax=Chryseobacterium lactis TaxID=1241981 RepID=A0A3G6RR54_CHRLC|nr:T9SS type A sorting domain-containing protein [Chryseobacterium lactis]AZA81791.1 T9SS C-terminal target domain-containing protein [Chryseobacterium lactis]AZB06788.1 T9SS C-terminal target domain-containing protein [Chryseobacterium lactis]PNW15641.1 hypothetical protein C1637_04245 [Chryseobacterium lactis]